MKICILTQALYTNYGGLLQAFALQTVLKRMGNEVVTDLYGAKKRIPYLIRFLKFNYHFLKRYILGDKRYNPFQFYFLFFNKKNDMDRKKIAVNTSRFIEQNISTTDFFCGKTYPEKKVLEKYDALIVGSDQVWRPTYSFVPAYFLDFAISERIRCIAYAASFGLNDMSEYTAALVAKCRKTIQRFHSISVREDSGVALCEKYFGMKAMHLLDPTLLLEKEDYLSIIDEDEIIRKKVLMCYVLDKAADKIAIIQETAKRLELIPLEVMPQEEYSTQTKDLSRCIFPPVSRWLAGFRDAEFVVTDSFHGTVFSIIFNKPFVAIANEKRGNSRFLSLLKIFGLEHRLISSVDELNEQLFLPVDFSVVNSIKNEWKEKSLRFLKVSLQ
ncbi:polysaccharide pyruvyl transferase family protein [Bacteroides sp.]